jgi:hypothetical protein
MAKQTLREFIEQEVAPTVRKIFQEDGYIDALYVVCVDDIQFSVPAFPTRNKDISVAMMRMYFKSVEADRYCYVDEAWTIEGEGKDRMEELKRLTQEEGVNIADIPGMREALIFTAEDRDGGMVLAQSIISTRGKKRSLGPLQFKEYGVTEGRMVGLLPRRPNATVQ